VLTGSQRAARARTVRLPDGLEAVDREYVTVRLEEAGRTLMALPAHGTAPAGMRVAWPEIVRSVWDAYDWTGAPVRPPRPTGAAIDAMDEAFGWIPLIGAQAVETKRLVWLRLLLWPLSGSHVWPWARLAKVIGLHRDTLMLRHGRGIDRIVTRLNVPAWVERPGAELP